MLPHDLLTSKSNDSRLYGTQYIVEPFIKHCIDIIFLSKNMKPVTFTWPYIHRLIRLSESIFHILTVLTYSDYTARFGQEISAPIISRENFHYFKLPCIYLQRLYRNKTWFSKFDLTQDPYPDDCYSRAENMSHVSIELFLTETF